MSRVERLRAIGDPAERIRAAREAEAEVLAERSAIVAVVREAAAEMHQTMTFGDMAKVLGVTRARAQQLAKPNRQSLS